MKLLLYRNTGDCRKFVKFFLKNTTKENTLRKKFSAVFMEKYYLSKILFIEIYRWERAKWKKRGNNSFMGFYCSKLMISLSKLLLKL